MTVKELLRKPEHDGLEIIIGAISTCRFTRFGSIEVAIAVCGDMHVRGYDVPDGHSRGAIWIYVKEEV